MNISSAITISDTPPYLAEARALQSVAAGFLPADNAEVKNASGTTTSYGLLKAGTILAKAADGSVHPCGLAALSDVTTGTLIATLGAVHQANYFIGDEVAVVASASSRTIALTGEADTETLRSATPHGLRVGDEVAISGLTGGAGLTAGNYLVTALATAPAALSVAGEAGTEVLTTPIAHGLRVGDTVTFSAFDDTTDAVEGTYVVASVPTTTTFTCTAFAFTIDILNGTVSFVDRSLTDFTVESEDGTAAAFTTDITAGTLTVPVTARSRNITGNRYITAINRTTGEITLSGAVFTAAIGDLLVKTKAYKPCGILDRNVSTLEYGPDHSTVAMGKTVPIRHEGTVRQGFIFGLSAAAKIALSGAPYADPLAPATIVQPECAGFLFRNL